MDQGEGRDKSSDLLNEPVSPDELNELLLRMSVSELHLSNHLTIRDVSEAMGRDPAAIAKLLGEIRQESFDQRFESTFGEHDERISKLEEAASQPTPVRVEKVIVEKVVPAKAGLGKLEREVLSDLARQRRIERAMWPFYVMILMLVGAFMIDNCGRSNQPRASEAKVIRKQRL